MICRGRIDYTEILRSIMKQITRFIIALGIERIRRLSVYMYVVLVPMHLLFQRAFWGRWSITNTFLAGLWLVCNWRSESHFLSYSFSRALLGFVSTLCYIYTNVQMGLQQSIGDSCRSNPSLPWKIFLVVSNKQTEPHKGVGVPYT